MCDDRSNDGVESVVAYLKAKTQQPLTDHGEEEYKEMENLYLSDKYNDLREYWGKSIQEVLPKEVFGHASLKRYSIESIFEDLDGGPETLKDLCKPEEDRKLHFYRSAQYNMKNIVLRLSKTSGTDLVRHIDELLALVGEEPSVLQYADSQPEDFSDVGASYVSKTTVQATTVGSNVHSMMFEHGNNRLDIKLFAFPGYRSGANSEPKSTLDDFLQQLKLDISAADLEPHVTRLRLIQGFMETQTKGTDEKTEGLTQMLFEFFLVQLLMLLPTEHDVEDVTGMQPAKSSVQVCKEYFQKQLRKCAEGEGPSSAALDLCEDVWTKLSLQSDLVITRTGLPRGTALLDTFMACEVNIEMKSYSSLRKNKFAQRTQLCGESIVRALEGGFGMRADDQPDVLYSVFSDCGGICVLIHQVKGDRTKRGKSKTTAEDDFFLSRWERGSDVAGAGRMAAILLWLTKLSRENKGFEDTGFKVLHEYSNREKPEDNEDDEEEEDDEGDAGKPRAKKRSVDMARVEEEVDNECEQRSQEEYQEYQNQRIHLKRSASFVMTSVEKGDEKLEDAVYEDVTPTGGLKFLYGDSFFDGRSSPDDEAKATFSAALRNSVHGGGMPLSHGVLHTWDEGNEGEKRRFNLSTGMWLSATDYP